MIETPSKLVDTHGRRIRKLRVSLTDVCNLRCQYCMPEDQRFLPSQKLLTPDEIVRITSRLVFRGVEQVRLTGGEPTARREFQDIVMRLGELPIKQFGLTSNGVTLRKYLPVLREARCLKINISCDSLDAESFRHITRRDVFKTVMDSIHAAKDAGFDVKLNVVMMAGVNDHEVFDFVRFSETNKIPVRFLELMRIGQACQSQTRQLITAADVIKKLDGFRKLKPITSSHDSTSFNYVTEHGGEIGFIAPESRPFCGSCSRWRLSAEGYLRACLMSNAGVSLKGVADDRLDDLFDQVLPMKPIGRIGEIHQDMNQIGG